MNQLERVYRIHELLSNARYPIHKSRFVEEMDCTLNTVTRDFSFMKNFFMAPIKWVRQGERNGYIYDPNEPVFELPGFWMNASELYALLVCEQLLESAQPGLMMERLHPLKRRIRDLLKQSGGKTDNIEDKLRIQSLYSREVNNKVFMQAATATLEGKRLDFQYHSRGQDATSQRHVSSQQLVHYRHSWYLAGWCHDADSLRLFALDRISKVSLSGQSAKRISKKEMEDFIGAGFGIFSGKPTAVAHLLFNAEAARWAADERWHAKQKNWWEGELFHLEIPYGNPKELVMEILRYGPNVQVVSPPALRDEVARNVMLMWKQYCP